MSSPPALRYETYYHIFNRGNNRQNIFLEDRNYLYFLKLYATLIDPVVETYAYCLLRNHFHLLVYIKPEEAIRESSIQAGKIVRNPSQQFSNFFNAYAKAINQTYQKSGSLFQHPFGRVEITSDTHFSRLVTYIHQNPQKHNFVPDFRTWRYSSYQAFLSDQPSRLKRDEVLAWFDGEMRFMNTHREFIESDDVKDWVPNDA